MAAFSAGLTYFDRAAPQHDDHVHGQVEETCSDVSEAELVPGFCIGHEICETEQKVGQGEYRGLIKCFNVVQKVVSERPVPLQVHAHAQGD